MRGTPIARRPLLTAAGASLAAVTLGGCSNTYPALPDDPGTRVYPRRASILHGESVTLHVSTPAPQFRVEFHRVGKELEFVHRSEWLTGVSAPSGRPDIEWDFPEYEVPLPHHARPGVYIASIVEGARAQPLSDTSPAARHGKAEALFVVRSPAERAKRILYKLALSTYHAYNYTGGGSLYHTACDASGTPLFDQWQQGGAGQPSGIRVTLLRPGGGVGGDLIGDPDYYDTRSGRNTFQHWDVHFIRWLESNGYDVDYCVGLDVHQDPMLLAPYRLLLSAGHDEYWSEPERDHTEDFVRTGGNFAIFSGNTCWWRIHYVDADTAIVCDKLTRANDDQWFRFRPENSITGVSYRFGGGHWHSKRPTLGYRVQHAEHWLYANTLLSNGDSFGADPEQPLIGYECDGIPYKRDAQGIAVPVNPSAYGTPSDFKILGFAELGKQWEKRDGHYVTMGIFSVPNGGSVFTASTTDWVKLLGRDERVARITQNVLDQMSAGA